MKKIAAVSLITSLIFFSCVSSSSDLSLGSEDSVEVTEQSDEANEIEQTAEFNEPDSSDTEDKASKPAEPETNEPEITENTNTSEEPVTEEILQPAYIPEEEKISDSDLADDAEKLKDTIETEPAQKEEITEELSSKETEIETKTEQEPKPSPVSVKTEVSEPAKKTQPQPAKKEEPKKEVKPQSAAKPELPAQPAPETSLDLQKEAAQASEELNNNESKEAVPVPSRNAEIKNNQFIDINYPGTGWVYLGEVERQNLLIFYGRKIIDDNTTFTLKSRKSGTTILHFYKNDVLSGKYIDDYIEVTIDSESATDNEHIVSPEYAKAVPPKPKKPETKSTEEVSATNETAVKTDTKPAPAPLPEKKKNSEPDLNIQTNIQNSGSTKQEEEKNAVISSSPVTKITNIAEKNKTNNAEVSGDLLAAAQKAYNEKRYSDALSLVKSFLSDTYDRIDQGLYLEAQILEAESEVQNIKESISDYDTLVKNWPQSRLWKKAKERSIYLKRFYIDIR